MTREELKEHCKRQIQQFERIEKLMPVTPNDWKRYEEHKLILELLEQETVSKEVYDHEYFLRKEYEVKIDKLQHDKNEVLNKIRAEIEPTRKMYLEMNDIDWLNGCDYVLSLIDKYKAESEDKE